MFYNFLPEDSHGNTKKTPPQPQQVLPDESEPVSGQTGSLPLFPDVPGLPGKTLLPDPPAGAGTYPQHHQAGAGPPTNRKKPAKTFPPNL